MYSLEQQAKRQDMASMGAMLLVPKLAWATALAAWLAAVIALPYEAIMRHSFGERYFTHNNVVFSLGASTIFAAAASFAGGDDILSTYLILATLASIAHLVILRWRRWQGEMWYSYYDGTSWAYTLTRQVWPSLNEGTVQRFLEPSPGFLLALIFFTAGRPALALFFLAIVGASMIGTNLRLQEQRHQWLDLIDSQLVGRYMAAAVRGASPEATYGVSIDPSNVRLIKQLSADEQMRLAVPLEMRAAVSELSSEEKAMLDN